MFGIMMKGFNLTGDSAVGITGNTFSKYGGCSERKVCLTNRL